MAVVSNLMSICEFDWKDMAKKTDTGIPDKNLIWFSDKKANWTRYLEIAPSLGWIQFNADSDSKVSTNGVPNDAEAEKLALEILFRLGIDRSLICDGHTSY